MHLSKEEVLTYFQDGRRISFMLERRIRDELGWKLAPSEGSGYDLVDKGGRKWEVRSVSNSIYFCPSYMVGSGRAFEEAGFIAKLDSIAGYVCSDIKKFPRVPVWIIPVECIRSLYQEGRLGSSTSISSANFYSRVVPLLPPPTVVDD
jgi:hypothetical protein